jgi:hypothetical protein
MNQRDRRFDKSLICKDFLAGQYGHGDEGARPRHGESQRQTGIFVRHWARQNRLRQPQLNMVLAPFAV